MSNIRTYQPERTDLLINTDWGIAQKTLDDDAAAARGLVLFHGRWVSPDEGRRIRDEAGAYSSIRHFGNLLLFISLLTLFWTFQAMRNNGAAGVLMLVPGAVCLAAGIGLRRYALWARNLAALMFALMIILPFVPAGSDDKGGLFFLVVGGLGLYYLFRKTAGRIFKGGV